jgi:hypothetical protein
VEDVICQHPAVAQAGVIGVPDDIWGESMRAFVVLKTGAAASADDLRTFLLERLSDWKVPDSIYFKHELPLGSTGKVDRRLLREVPARQRREANEDERADSSSLFAWMFASTELGGHSPCETCPEPTQSSLNTGGWDGPVSEQESGSGWRVNRKAR